MFHRSLALCLLLLSAHAACSQVPTLHKSTTVQGDVFAGLAFISSDAGFGAGNPGSNIGWNVGMDLNPARPWIAVSPEFIMGSGRVTNASSTTYTGLIGPRFLLPLPRLTRLKPFADVMVGFTNVSIGKSVDSLRSRAGATETFDVGADFRIAGRFWWRGQIGYLHSMDITHINDEVQDVPNLPAWHLQVSTGEPVLRLLTARWV